MMMIMMMILKLTVIVIPSNSGWRKGVHSADKLGFVPSLEIDIEAKI